MYDTIVIGSDLSSTVAALTSVRDGFKTALVIEGETNLVYRESGYSFPFDSKPLFGHLNRRSFSHLFEETVASDGVTHDERIDPVFQIILPGHRIDLFRNQERLTDELLREYPTKEHLIESFNRGITKTAKFVDSWIEDDMNGQSGMTAGILRHLGRLPRMITSKLSLGMLSKKLDKSIKCIAAAQVSYLSHLETQNESLSSPDAYLLSLPRRGLLFQSCGGLMPWMGNLRRLFQSRGGILMDGCSIIRTETDPAVTVDIERHGSPSTLRGEKLIVSAQWEKLEILMPGKRILPAMNRPFSTLRIASYPFCLHLGVREECLPEKIAPYTVLLHGSNDSLIKGDFVFLQVSPSGDAGRAPEGRRAITATVYIAESPLRVSDPDLKKVALVIIDSLDDYLPFLRENIDFLRVDQSISFSRRCQEVVSRVYKSRKRTFGRLKTSTPKTRLPNVTLTGSILRPGLGFEGEILAGLDAALQVRRELKRMHP
jgi:phytoene dehydrogenase-like protein